MIYKLDKDLYIYQLFFAKTTSQKMLKFNCEVLLMDCICQTYMYKMFLYTITEVTPLNTIYYIVFDFFIVETIDDYYWVLDSPRKLYEFFDILDPKVIITNANFCIICTILEEFPFASHFLYLWYINKNVMANCKSYLRTKSHLKNSIKNSMR